MTALPEMSLLSISSMEEFSMAVSQLRIGTYTLSVSSPVNFKQQGISFSIPHHTSRPFLVNAKAIIKVHVTANKDDFVNNRCSFPAIFISLESTCIHQIQKFFKLSDDQFSENSNVYLARYFTIFPCSLSGGDADRLIKAFQNFSVNSSNIRCINQCNVLDILYNSSITVGTETDILSPETAISHKVTIVGSVPVLKIPNSEESWNLIKTRLINGGVYFIEFSNHKQAYCLWNGKELIPCEVGDTLSLKCHTLLLGTVQFNPTDGMVKLMDVENDPKLIISVNIPAKSPAVLNLPLTSVFGKLCQLTNKHLIQFTFKEESYSIVHQFLKTIGMPIPTDMSSFYLKLLFVSLSKKEKNVLLSMKSPSSGALLVQEVPAPSKKPVENQKNTAGYQSAASSSQSSSGAIPDPSKLANKAYLAGVLQVQQTHQYPVTTPENPLSIEDDLTVIDFELSLRCPYSQKPMKDPVKNIYCGHSFERSSLINYLESKKKHMPKVSPKCPYSGCPNDRALELGHLVDDLERRKLILQRMTEES